MLSFPPGGLTVPTELDQTDFTTNKINTFHIFENN